ncbi:MAG: hypothetical protein HYU29_03120 [Chloroflexi bacterium]|nr:hypothetical protein [Chloroflexota bacterium]
MEIRKGTVKGFDPASYKATIQVAGSLSAWLSGVPVARNIPSGEMTSGRSCAVLFFDIGNPSDAVVIAVYT